MMLFTWFRFDTHSQQLISYLCQRERYYNILAPVELNHKCIALRHLSELQNMLKCSNETFTLFLLQNTNW